jgi:hypothetical protein
MLVFGGLAITQLADMHASRVRGLETAKNATEASAHLRVTGGWDAHKQEAHFAHLGRTRPALLAPVL